MPFPRYVYFIPALIAVAWLGWWLFGTPAEKQMLAAQDKFFAAVEDRDWKEVQSMLAASYTDAFGHTRENAVGDAQQALGHFLSLTLQTSVMHSQAQDRTGESAVTIHMEGNGLGFSQMVLSHVNSMKEPWHFQWQKEGPWPWSWKILRIHHNELSIPNFE